MYYLGFIYLFALVFLGKNLKNSTKLLLAITPFVVISFVRFGVGADYLSYEEIYLKMDISNYKNSMAMFPKVEPLFKIVSMISKKLGIPYHIFFATLNSIIAILVVKWIDINSPRFWLSTLLYFSMFFLFWNLSALRQGLTMIIMFYVFFNKDKDYSIKVKVMTTIFCMLIHVSSILIVPLYIISLLKWDRKKLILILIAAPFVKIILRPEYLTVLAGLPFMGKLMKYLGQDPISFFEFTSLVRLVFFVAIWLHYEQLIEKYEDQRVLINFSIISLLLYFFVPVSKVIATRVTIYGYFLTIIVFPMIVTLYNQKALKTIFMTGLLSFSTFSLVNELDKAKARTGYVLSINELNLETVFNKNLKHFRSDRAFESTSHYHSTTSYENDEILQKILNNDGSETVPFDKTLSHLSVKFSNGLYGVINERGEVVVSPTETSRLDIIEGHYIEKISEKYQYSYNRARSIEDSTILNKDAFQSLLEKSNYAKSLREASRVLPSQFDTSKIEKFDFLEQFNFDALVNKSLQIDTFNPNVRYLQLSTKSTHYYLLLDKEDNVLVDRFYGGVSRINDQGIIKTYSRDFSEYFNSQGELIWAERR